jgi:hypothetical protein
VVESDLKSAAVSQMYPESRKRKQVTFVEGPSTKRTARVGKRTCLTEDDRDVDCELLGSMSAQNYSQELCDSAKKWIRGFKNLREGKGVHNVEHRIKVAVLDTGVDSSHTAIEGNVCDYTSFIDGDASVDADGHGTHIAGIILVLYNQR